MGNFDIVRIYFLAQQQESLDMAVKKKLGNKNNPAFAGIIVAGASKIEAINQYRAVASGEDAQALRSADSKYQMVTVASAADGFHDPLTGNNDMVAVDAKIDMASESSDLNEPVHAFMTICADGCGDVVIADSDQAVKFCPSCSSAIPPLSNEEIDRLSSESETETTLEGPNGHQGVIVAAKSFDDAENLYLQAMNGENVTGINDNTGAEDNVSESGADQLAFNTHSSCEIKFSPFYGESSVEQCEDVVGNFEATASEQDGETGHQGQYLLCSNDVDCGMHIIASNNESVFCPSCSGSLVDPADLEEMENVALANDDETIDDDENEAYASVSESDDEGDDDLESESGSDADDEDEVDTDVSDEDGDDDEDDEDDDDDLESESGADIDDEDGNLESNSMDDMDDDEDGDDFDEEDADLDDLDDLEDDEEDEDFDSESSNQEFKVNLLQLVASNEDDNLEAANLSVAHCGAIVGVETWTAFYKGTPVAMAKSNAVPDTVSAIFNTAKFGEAVAASARELGVEQALSSMGFQAIQPDCSVEVAVADSIMSEAESIKQQALASVDSTRNDMAESFGAALATAAMGINRGVFAGVSNPIRDNLIASLSAAGIKDPAPLVDRAFEQGSDSYAKILLAKATDINSKAPEVQNQIAESVSQTNFLAAQASVQGVEDIGTVIASTEQTQQPVVTEPLASESSATSMKSMVQGLNLSRR